MVAHATMNIITAVVRVAFTKTLIRLESLSLRYTKNPTTAAYTTARHPASVGVTTPPTIPPIIIKGIIKAKMPYFKVVKSRDNENLSISIGYPLRIERT